MDVLTRTGSDRCVILTFNSRNWQNYPDLGVIVLWSDGDIAEWLTFEEARQEWGITRAEWEDPAGQLFGRKAPFQFTYDDRTGSNTYSPTRPARSHETGIPACWRNGIGPAAHPPGVLRLPVDR